MGDHVGNDNVLMFGCWNTTSEYFNGLLDEIRISNVARYTSAFTVSTLPLIPDANTVALWQLDEGTGQTTADATGSTWNGILGATTATETSDPTWSTDSPFQD